MPSFKVNISLPADILARVTADLWSDAEKRVPKGAYQKFFVRLIKDHFARVDGAKELSSANDPREWVGHKPDCFVYINARGLIGQDRRGLCTCGFEQRTAT